MERVRPFFDTTDTPSLRFCYWITGSPPVQMYTSILRYLSKGSLKIWRNILCSQLQSTLQRDGLRYWITVVAWLCGASSIWPKVPKIWKQRQMARKFHGKVLRKSEKCWIYEMRAIQLKILEYLGEQSWIEINLPRYSLFESCADH